MIYRRQIRVEFNHCDPAGIVFYPRYFEMTNAVAENFFRDVAGDPYEAMVARKAGVPTAGLRVNFHAPSRLGDLLDWEMRIARLGRTALDLHITATSRGEPRLSAELTLVHVGSGGRPEPWPEPVRQRIADFQETP